MQLTENPLASSAHAVKKINNDDPMIEGAEKISNPGSKQQVINYLQKENVQQDHHGRVRAPLNWRDDLCEETPRRERELLVRKRELLWRERNFLFRSADMANNTNNPYANLATNVTTVFMSVSYHDITDKSLLEFNPKRPWALTAQ